MDNSKWILHIEFQSKNDPQMLERMQEYHSKIYKKFKLPVKPLVINLGQQKFTARTQLQPEEIFTGYQPHIRMSILNTLNIKISYTFIGLRAID